MNGIAVLLLLILISAIPVLPLFLWIRRRAFPIRPSWFLLALLAGAVSLALAALLQILIPASDDITMGNLIVSIFVRIALTEEVSRLLVLLAFFAIARRFASRTAPAADTTFSSSSIDDVRVCGVLTGIIAGLGFAVIETALYGSSNFTIALVRAITAAPLHGACGARIGLGAVQIRTGPLRSIGNIFYAVIIHGMYNFMLISPGIPVIFPVLIAITAFFSVIQSCRTSS
jgi:RsiW-degrading membrane proteinase PrsW (M82 family)